MFHPLSKKYIQTLLVDFAYSRQLGWITIQWGVDPHNARVRELVESPLALDTNKAKSRTPLMVTVPDICRKPNWVLMP